MSLQKRLALLAAFAVLTALTSACTSSTPTEAMKAICQAAKDRNVGEYKKSLSKRKLMEFDELARRTNSSLDELLKGYLNNITCPTAVQLGNTNVHGDAATLEFRETPTSRPDHYNFVREDGVWKLD